MNDTFGLQVLLARRARIVVALFGAVPMVGLLAGLLALFPPWRSWLAADPLRAVADRTAARISAAMKGTYKRTK